MGAARRFERLGFAALGCESGGFEMQPVFTGAQIRAAEQPLLEAGRGAELMRTASHGLAAAVRSVLVNGGVYGARITGLIGSGNNGGDGLYALAQLRSQGADARAVLVGRNVHEAGLEAFRRAGGQVVNSVPGDTVLLIDAMVGTGFQGEFRPRRVPGLEELLEQRERGSWREPHGQRGLKGCGPVVVACDLPSGVNADTGEAGAAVIAADLTVTFGGLKTGLFMGNGGTLSGTVRVVDIGLGPYLPEPAAQIIDHSTTPLNPRGVSDELQPKWLRLAGPAADAHKYSRGVVHIMAGSEQFPGAAQLCVGAAVHTGVGMVQLSVAGQPDMAAGGGPVADAVLSKWPEAVLIPEAGTDSEAAPDAETAPDFAAALKLATAVVIGPGLGEKPARIRAAETLMNACLERGLPCVVDASGLQMVTGKLGPNVLLTPHLGEARGLLNRLVEREGSTPQRQRAAAALGLGETGETGETGVDPLTAAQLLAEEFGAHVLLKGSTTVIALPQGTAPVIHRAEAPGLATAGSGDVLSGILGAVLSGKAELAGQTALAEQMSVQHAGAIGVVLHSHAARRLDPQQQGQFGASALIAELGA